MALFTPIVEIAETDTKENLPKEVIKNESIDNNNQFIDQVEFLAVEKIKTEQPDEDLNVFKQTLQKMNRTSKRKRGRPKKIVDVRQFDVLKKPKRKYTKKVCKTAGEIEAPKKKSRKQSSPKKKPLEVIQNEVNYPEDDLLVSPDEHFDLTKLIKCPLCKNDKEWNLNEVKQHYKDDHPGKRLRISRFFGETHPCDICSKEFKSPGSLRDHVETHNNYYYCDICNHSTKKILDHVIHLRVHNPLGFFQCLMCDLTTVDINQITEHVTNHQDVMKYWCDSCKKSFTILQHFQEHENYHTGLKPFDCEFCGKCFLYSRFLHAHKVNMHKEVMNCPNTYQCVICHKIYQHRNSLKLHMNSHTGNFAICDVCGKTLSSKEKLKFHLRTHTGYKPYRYVDVIICVSQVVQIIFFLQLSILRKVLYQKTNLGGTREGAHR